MTNAGFNINFYCCDYGYDKYDFLDIPVIYLNADTNLDDLNILICIGAELSRENDLEFIKSKNISIIRQICGNEFILTQEDIIFNCHKRDFYNNNKYYDEVWLLPMYEHMKEYTETLNDIEVQIVPYVWDSTIIDKFQDLNNNDIYCNYSDESIFNKPKSVLIAEPNMSIHKTCLVPLTIVEKTFKKLNNKDLLNKVFLLCKPDGDSFNNFVSKLEFVKNNKLEAYPRINLMAILGQLNELKLPIICLSHQILNELNFLHLELMYLGYPVIHNCGMIKDIGYFYPYNTIYSAADNLYDICTGNIKYSNKNLKDKIYRFSPDNPKNIEKYREIMTNSLNKHKISMENKDSISDIKII